MSTTLQLLANYYKSVLENERTYLENVKTKIPEKIVTESANLESSARIGSEILVLQRQLTQLSSDLQMMRHENEQLKESQKHHKASMESKLNTSKKTVEKLRQELIERYGNDESNLTIDTNKSFSAINTMVKNKGRIHLLSPIVNKSPLGRGPVISKTKLHSLRQVISSGKHTLFDDDSDKSEVLSLESSQDVLFVNSLRKNEMLADIILPKDGLSQSSVAGSLSPVSCRTEENSGSEQYKKRKLTRKRIQNIESEDSLQ